MFSEIFDVVLEDVEDDEEFIRKENNGLLSEKEKVPVGKNKIVGQFRLSRISRHLATFDYFLNTRVQDILFNFLKKTYHFIRYNVGEIMKRRVAFFLGIFSVVLVVITCTCTISVTEQLPMIFFRIAENTEGQYDMVIRSDADLGWSVNFTHLVRSLQLGTATEEQYEEFSLLSPRMSITGNTHLVNYDSCIRKKNGERLSIWYDGNNRKEVDWVYMYSDSIILNETSSTGCVNSTNEFGESVLDSCEFLVDLCSEFVNIPIVLFDTTREEEMGFGKNWEFPKMRTGECIITEPTAQRFDLAVGDDVILGGNLFNGWEVGFLGLLDDIGYIDDVVVSNNYDEDFYESIWAYVGEIGYEDVFKFPCTIVGISKGHQGKTDYVLDIDEPVVFMEYEHFYEHLGTYLDMHRFGAHHYSDLVRISDPYDYAHYVYLNYKDRTKMYNSANFEKVQERITEFAGRFLYIVGFDQVEVRYPLLYFLENISFIGLFLNLIINIIITILVGLSVILIYSLLMIHVEERTFEMGVLRMVGLRLFGLVEMIVIQSMMYSLPGIVLGLVGGQLLYLGIAFILAYYLNSSVSPFANWESVVISISVGTIIPLVGSIVPIRKAMGKSLNESLDTRRSKVKAVKIRIERSTDKSIPWSLVIVASGSFGFGFFIYYFFPLAMITQRFQILLFVFFCVLLMMLVGCVLLSINLEGILQNLVTRIILFWEFASVKKLVVKNLIAHKIRNRKTTIMYGISLSFLIFLSVSTTLEIRLYQFSESRILGARFRLEVSLGDIQQKDLNSEIMWAELDNLVYTEEYVEDYAYMSFPISKMTNDSRYCMQTIGGYVEQNTDFSAISANFYEVLDERYLIVTNHDKSTSWSLSEQLYSVNGAYGYMGGLGEQKDLVETPKTLDENVVYRIERPTEQFTKYRYFLKRFNSIMESASGSTFSKYDTETSIHVELFQYKVGADGFISFPEMFSLVEHEGIYAGVKDIPIRFVFIQMSENANEDQTLKIRKRIVSFLNENNEFAIGFEDRKDRLDRLKVVDDVLSIFFYLSTTLAMLMCFFSLVANMITNVSEQSKEIGILRAMGCRKCTITRVYVYEAVVIIYTAGVIGTLTGSFIAYTFVLQQQLFTQLPLGFAFPTEIVVIVLVGGVLCGFLASIGPICCLLRRSPVQIMRRL